MHSFTEAELPRPEYPRPHRVRPHWLNLNGWWQFAFDDEDRGLREGWESGRELPLRILVPFTFEAPLSGIGERTAHPIVWYRRQVDIPAAFLDRRLLLHIGACDFAARIWVNGRAAGAHRGGYTPVACDIRDFVQPGVNEIVVRVEDRPVWSQPRGKQIVGEEPAWIDYDRVTGIWQTVWLEPVPEIHVVDVWSHFHLCDHRLVLAVEANQEFAGEVEVVLAAGGAEVARARAYMQERREAQAEITLCDPHLWSPSDPALYDVTVVLRDGDAVIDTVRTYTGLREFTRHGRTLRLNGEPFYFRGVLDQGYFPGGWYTAPTDADLRRDIELMQALGFNGARKHQKAEDPRWLYWADRLGFVVWGEMGNGRDFCDAHVEDFTREWIEVVRRDRMHPSIMAWVPLNESWGVDAVDHSPRQQAWVQALFHLTKGLDGSRFVLANDGWQYLIGDIWGLHSYVADAAALSRHLQRVLAEPATELAPGRQAALPGADVTDVPIMLTECGGLAFRRPESSAAKDAWGYAVVTDAGELAGRIRSLVQAVRDQSGFSGFVWTQFTDVQQEINGVCCFDRTPKLPVEVFRAVFADWVR